MIRVDEVFVYRSAVGAVVWVRYVIDDMSVSAVMNNAVVTGDTMLVVIKHAVMVRCIDRSITK